MTGSSEPPAERLIPAITIGGILGRFDLDAVATADGDPAKLLPPGKQPPHYVRFMAEFLSDGVTKPQVLLKEAAMKAVQHGSRVAITLSLIDDNG